MPFALGWVSLLWLLCVRLVGPRAVVKRRPSRLDNKEHGSKETPIAIRIPAGSFGSLWVPFLGAFGFGFLWVSNGGWGGVNKGEGERSRTHNFHFRGPLTSVPCVVARIPVPQRGFEGQGETAIAPRGRGTWGWGWDLVPR